MRNRMSELEDTNIKDDIDKYYYAYFEIDSDGDFYFEDYKNLNGKRFISKESPEKLMDLLLKHLRHAIDTFRTDRDYLYDLKDKFEELYQLLSNSDEDFCDEGFMILYYKNGGFCVECDFGNYHIEYSIELIPMLNLEE